MALNEAYADRTLSAYHTDTTTQIGLAPQFGDLRLDHATRRFLLLVAGAFALLRLWAIWAIPFTDTTEARYAEIARKMVETGNWLTPQFDYGVPFWGKPPLHTWLAAGGMQVFGINEAAARLPILMTALAVLWLVFIWVRHLVGVNTALVATVVLGTMAMFFGAGAFVMTDMPMVLGTTLVMVGFWQATTGAEGGRGWGYAVFAGLAIGMLAKGPVAVVLSMIPLVMWLALTRNWQVLGRLPWARGMGLLMVLVVPWYVAAEIATPGFLRYFLIGEHIERFLTPGWQGDLYGSGHQEAKGMIWVFWLAAALPWAIAPLLLLARPVRTLGAFRHDRSGWLLYLLLWAISPLVLFTPASNILAAYVLPGLPAAAVLLVVMCAHVFGSAPRRPAKAGFATAAILMFVVFGGLAAGAVFAPQTLRLKTDKALVATARSARPDAPLYTIGARSYSAEFYSNGKARALPASDLARQVQATAPAAYSVPPDMVAQAEGAGLENLGAYGRHFLFVSPETAEVE